MIATIMRLSVKVSWEISANGSSSVYNMRNNFVKFLRVFPSKINDAHAFDVSEAEEM